MLILGFLKNQLAEHAEIVGRDHETAEKEVAEFKPELEKAMAQVKLIRGSDITTMRVRFYPSFQRFFSPFSIPF